MLAHAAPHQAQTSCDPLTENNCSMLRDSVSPLTGSSSSASVLVVSSITGSTQGQTSIDRSFRHELPRSSQGACAHREVANCQPKSLKLVKERLCFYSCQGRSQWNFHECIRFVFNRVQLVHRRMPDFCANTQLNYCSLVFHAEFTRLSW